MTMESSGNCTHLVLAVLICLLKFGSAICLCIDYTNNNAECCANGCLYTPTDIGVGLCTRGTCTDTTTAALPTTTTATSATTSTTSVTTTSPTTSTTTTTPSTTPTTTSTTTTPTTTSTTTTPASTTHTTTHTTFSTASPTNTPTTPITTPTTASVPSTPTATTSTTSTKVTAFIAPTVSPTTTTQAVASTDSTTTTAVTTTKSTSFATTTTSISNPTAATASTSTAYPVVVTTSNSAETITLRIASIHCQSAPSVISQHSIGYSSSGPPYPERTVAKYICLSTYEIGTVTNVTCTNGNWTYPLPVCNPPAVVMVVVKAVMTMSCTFLVIALSIIFAANLIIRDFSIESCLHMNEELSLLLAHILLLLFRDRVDNTQICTMTAVLLQYLFSVNFLFMLTEALQSLYMLHNIISFGGIYDNPRKWNTIYGWIAPAIPTAITAALYHDSYPSFNCCWVNLSATVSGCIIVPILIAFLLVVILTEAASMGQFRVLPLTSKNQLIAAHVNQKSMMPLVCLSMASWFVGMWASYNATASLFSMAATINVIFGVVIIIFHFFGNKKISDRFRNRKETAETA